MTSRESTVSGSPARIATRRTSPSLTAFAVDESRLEPPRLRPGIVARPDLVERLAGSTCPIVAVVAAAGYGKTTLLAQWVAEQDRVAWVTADERDDDPAVLLAHLRAALARVEPSWSGSRSVRAPIVAGATTLADITDITARIAAMPAPVALVVDNAEAVASVASRDVLAELALRLPAGARLVIGSREQPALPVARLRAEGRYAELGHEDLAMDGPEARRLLDGAGVRVDSELANRLLARSEGWPAGLYLAALTVQRARSRAEAAETVTGNDRFLGDYLRSVLLSRVSDDELVFLTRTSVLARLTAGLCDATIGRRGSSQVLDRLERRNLLVVPLDRRGDWYRYHHLLRELLHTELLRREPQAVPELHARAAAWHEANGLPEVAIDHAQAAGDEATVARLVLDLANSVWASGRIDTVLRWMEWFAVDDRLQRNPAIAAHGALIYALLGRAAEAERWARAAATSEPTGTAPDGNSVEGTLAYERAIMCHAGLDALRRDARVALAGLHPLSPYRPAMFHALAVADLLDGRPDEADVLFATAQEEASSTGQTPFVALLLAERGLCALERSAWATARSYAEQALSRIEDGSFDDYWTTALVYAYGAHVTARAGDRERARDLATHAGRLRTLLTAAIPIVSTQALLELARASVAVGDAGGAQAALRQAEQVLRQRPALDSLAAQARELRTAITAMQGEMLGLSSLSTAELRVLAMLPSHLTIAAIGDRLHLSRNTVKAHAASIYRKLDVASRGEVVRLLEQLDSS